MDMLEKASQVEDQYRAAAVEDQLARGSRQKHPAKHAADGQRVCAECDEPISHQRLAAVPHATCCIDCAERGELLARQYAGGASWVA